MRVSIDGGALCTAPDNMFGNYIFTKNLLEAIYLFDKKNTYSIYSFCKKPSWLKLNDKLNYKILIPNYLWLSTRVSLEEITEKKDVFLALNQALPIIASPKIISFSHGLSFHFYPDFYPDSYYALEDQVKPMVRRSKNIIVSSIKVKRELSKLFPDYKGFVVINYGIPFGIIPFNRRIKKKFFLYVGMDHPIKNIQFIINVFNKIRKEKSFSDYKLFLIGNLSRYQDIKNNIYTIERIERAKLRKLYSKATAYLTASYYESFNFPVLEALAKECPVVGLESAIIPELKKYVFQAKTFDRFVDSVKQVAQGKETTVNYLEVRKQFSWRKYITKLIKLYD